MINQLKKLIRENLIQIEGVKEVSFQMAKDDALFPHIVYYFDGDRALTDDNHRRDFSLFIDVWDKSTDSTLCNELTDSIVALFQAKNIPTEEILPTFYYESTTRVIDEDKTIKHNQIKFTVQNYER